MNVVVCRWAERKAMMQKEIGLCFVGSGYLVSGLGADAVLMQVHGMPTSSAFKELIE